LDISHCLFKYQVWAITWYFRNQFKGKKRNEEARRDSSDQNQSPWFIIKPHNITYHWK
jgi:hypothetical protein